MKLDEAIALQDQLMKDIERTGTLCVGVHGGPGTGKSTTSALVFGALKQRGHNVEMAHEYAKDLVWEQRGQALGFQPYIIAKQMWRERRLEGQVDAVLTDTSTLYCMIYGDESNGVTPAFRRWVIDEYHRGNHLDFFLERDPTRAYNPKGRTQTEEEAKGVDGLLRGLLISAGVDFEVVQVDKDSNSHVDFIVNRVEATLALQGTMDA